MNPKILLTGFKPFCGISRNVSQEVIHRINPLRWRDSRYYFVVMPVEWRSSRRILLTTVRKLKPDIIFSLGHNDDAEVFHLEPYFCNFITFRDESGRLPPRPCIIENGPDIYQVNVPLDRLEKILKQHGIPARINNNIHDMTFLCGYAAYLSRYYAEKYCDNAVTMFIHLPPPEKLEFETIMKGVKLVIEFLVDLKTK